MGTEFVVFLSAPDHLMKLFIKLSLILIIVGGVVSFSCRRLEEFPPEPSIKYTDFEKIFNSTDSIYDKGILKFTFTDGDGDMGLAKGDTFPPFNFGSKYYYNLIIDFWEVQNGKETKVDLTSYNAITQQYDTISLSARIPPLTPTGNNKSISGDIYDTLFMYNYTSSFDTLFFEFSIIDRALHESNLERTPYIVRK
jgi:hypothetical protein